LVKCYKYRCSDGNITQIQNSCKPPPQDNCTAIYLKHDDCCPIYDCPKPPCTVGELTFDGCNHCTCVPPGVQLCTLKHCQPAACPVPGKPGGYQHNQKWVNPNNTCQKNECRYGAVLTTTTLCPPAPGPQCISNYVDGQCCPDWDCPPNPCPANVSDVMWEHDCQTCSCTDVGVVCTEQICPKECLEGGTSYHTGDLILGDDRCDRYTCMDGVAISALDECMKRPHFGCLELNSTGDCCPSWNCTAVPGMSTPCEPGEIYQSDTECVYCKCLNHTGTPSAFCRKGDCVEHGCVDETGAHYHGTVWATANPCKHRACMNGAIQHLEVQCAHTNTPRCHPITETGRCCPVYVCDSEPCTNGTSFTVDCNTCICQDGVPFCTKQVCPSQPQQDRCPRPTQPLVLPNSHANKTCYYGNSDCGEKDSTCCDGRCVAVNDKPGTCPSYLRRGHDCSPRPGYNCNEDHQCPGAHKCCKLPRLPGCPFKFCMSSGGDILSNHPFGG